MGSVTVNDKAFFRVMRFLSSFRDLFCMSLLLPEDVKETHESTSVVGYIELFIFMRISKHLSVISWVGKNLPKSSL